MINYELDGKVAVITGGASGIGKACAHTMARSGADLSLWDLDQSALDATLDELKQYGHRVHTVVVDVSDRAAVDAAMDDVLAHFGRVDIAVANAGIGGPIASSGDYTDEGWHKVIGINLDGVFYTQRAAIRAMKTSGGGSIINMASILGMVGFAMSSAYVAAKHGVVGMTTRSRLGARRGAHPGQRRRPGLHQDPARGEEPRRADPEVPRVPARVQPAGRARRGGRARDVARE